VLLEIIEMQAIEHLHVHQVLIEHLLERDQRLLQLLIGRQQEQDQHHHQLQHVNQTGLHHHHVHHHHRMIFLAHVHPLAAAVRLLMEGVEVAAAVLVAAVVSVAVVEAAVAECAAAAEEGNRIKFNV
jgi:hypothetical protein